MRIIFIAIGFLTFAACAPRDKQFCECIEISKEFNELTQKGLSGDLSKEELNKARQLQKQKSKICADYETMSGEEMMKKKATCGIEE